MIKGGDLNNAIVYVDNEISDRTHDKILKVAFGKDDIAVMPNGILDNLTLRYPNEAARHKLLDVIGDLSLIGTRIQGKVIANKPGHFVNTQFAKKMSKIIKAEQRNQVPTYRFESRAFNGYQQNHGNVATQISYFCLLTVFWKCQISHVVGMKNVTMNEEFFLGHFPGAPVMPGVINR